MVNFSRKKIDFILVAINFVIMVLGVVNILIAITSLLNVEFSRRVLLDIVRPVFKNAFHEVGVSLSISGVGATVSGCIGIIVGWYKKYAYYRQYVLINIFLAMVVCFPLTKVTEINVHFQPKSVYVTESPFTVALEYHLSRSYTGGLRTTDHWSVYWDYYQITTGCCGVTDYQNFQDIYIWHEHDPFNSSMIRTRRYPTTCCDVDDLAIQMASELQRWLSHFLLTKPGTLFDELPFPQSGIKYMKWQKCLKTQGVINPFLRVNKCGDKIVEELSGMLKIIQRTLVLPTILIIFCTCTSLWYLFNQAYGLPENFELYMTNLQAGLHRASDPESIVLQINYPAPSLDAIRSHLMHEKPGDAQVTKLLMQSKKATASEDRGDNGTKGGSKAAGTGGLIPGAASLQIDDFETSTTAAAIAAAMEAAKYGSTESASARRLIGSAQNRKLSATAYKPNFQPKLATPR